MAEPSTSLPAANARAATPPAANSLFQSFLSEAAERGAGTPLGLKDFVDLAEAWRIVHALRECRGNRSAAARQLGIGRRTLYTKMEKLGIEESFQIAWR